LRVENITSLKKLKFSNLLVKSVIAGFLGYILFLGILFATKLVASVIQIEGNLKFEMIDFVLPLIGFILLFLIRLLENYKLNNDF